MLTRKEDAAMSKVTKDMIIADVLQLDTATAPIFLANGMHCLGCPSSMGETIEDACFVHGMDADKLVGELNDYFANALPAE
jgi:hybrid cluster-associated redox disulfide protein